MGWIKKQYEKTKRGIKDEYKHRVRIREAEKESYRAAQLKEAESFGKKKAAYESGQKLKRLKQKRSFEFSGFAGPTQKQPVLNLGVGEYLIGGSKKKKRDGYDDDMRLF